MKKLLPFFLIISFTYCYTAKPVEILPRTEKLPERTLFIALDGIDHTLMNELKDEGHFKSFGDVIPLISTFPSATTIGFTGIFRPLNVGKVPGYESRFYSHKENKIVGGTPFDFYKIPVNYKHYFDAFRHTMQEKMIMYSFPGMASRQDLMRTKKVALSSDKNILMTYLGGTDGSAHMLGRARTKRTLIYMDDFLQRLQKKHREEKGEDLRIVLYSDHGFQYNSLKHVSNNDIQNKLKNRGFSVNDKIESDQDVVLVKFGLLSSGVAFTKKQNRESVSDILCTVEGIDLVFWHLDDEKKVFVKNATGDTAVFEYQDRKKYRYVPINGDPLKYVTLLTNHHLKPGQWLSDEVWKTISFDHEYPDAGYRLHDSFFHLVENQAGVMFSLKPNYQFGPVTTWIGTMTKLGQHGTHGGLFKQTSWAFAMTNEKKSQPKMLRYDELFTHFIPEVAKAYSQKSKIITYKTDTSDFKKQLASLEEWLFALAE